MNPEQSVVRKLPKRPEERRSSYPAHCHIISHPLSPSSLLPSPSTPSLHLLSRKSSRSWLARDARRWTPGECLIFDDAFEHEVWNDGAQERALLLFEERFVHVVGITFTALITTLVQCLFKSMVFTT